MKIKGCIELSLRPYNGRLFVTFSPKSYEDAHEKIFRETDVLNCNDAGRFGAGEGKDGLHTYLIWGPTPHILAHEVSHVILDTFERCGIDPRSGNGEPFCYMLSQLILEINQETLGKNSTKHRFRK